MTTVRTPATLSRRGFLRKLAGAAVACPVAFTVGRPGRTAPSERITIGCIGMGGHGTSWNLSHLLGEKDAQVVAVCDVFRDRAEKARAIVDQRYGGKGCASYMDFRKIIERDDIDAVMISTPDHWHVLLSVIAMRAGKDVICEKPMLTIQEGRFLCDTVTRHKAVFQTSTEDRSIPVYHQMAQIVRNGVLGKLARVEVELPAGQRFPNEEPAPVPEGLDYDLWLGPAPYAPYTPNRTERQHWRHIWDYSGGKFTDWGMHQLDTVQLALDMERSGPIRVEGKGTVNEGSMYNTFITYDVKYTYSNGVEVRVKSGGTSLKFYGTGGWVGNGGWRQPLEGSSKEILKWKPGEGDIRLYTNPRGEHRDFLDCVKTRKDPYFPAEAGHRCSSLLHIGNISMLLGRALRWSPEKEEFVNDDQANSMRARPLRKPWSLEA